MSAEDIARAIEGLEDRDLLRLTVYISAELRARIRAYRVIRRILEDKDLGRISDIVAQAAAVAPRQAAKIEARARAMIASEAPLEQLQEESFGPHEALMAEAEATMHDLKHSLASLTNNPPLSISDDSSKDAPQPCQRCAVGEEPRLDPVTMKMVHDVSTPSGTIQVPCTTPKT